MRFIINFDKGKIMGKRIILDYKNVQKIIKAFKITRPMISYALTFNQKHDSDLAKRIRRMAVINGGIECVEYPVEEVMHDDGSFIMQEMKNGAVIKIDKCNGNLSLTYKEKEIVKSKDISIRELALIQDTAKKLAGEK